VYCFFYSLIKKSIGYIEATRVWGKLLVPLLAIFLSSIFLPNAKEKNSGLATTLISLIYGNGELFLISLFTEVLNGILNS